MLLPEESVPIFSTLPLQSPCGPEVRCAETSSQGTGSSLHC